MTIYATPTELAAYMNPGVDSVPAPPANAGVLLRSASGLVADAIAYTAYSVAEGLPTDSTQAQAVKDATCEQAQAWSLHDIDPRLGASSAKRRVASKSLNGASVSYVADAAADLADSALASGTELTSAAYGILDRAGLISHRVTTGYVGQYTPAAVGVPILDGGGPGSEFLNIVEG